MDVFRFSSLISKLMNSFANKCFIYWIIQLNLMKCWNIYEHFIQFLLTSLIWFINVNIKSTNFVLYSDVELLDSSRSILNNIKLKTQVCVIGKKSSLQNISKSTNSRFLAGIYRYKTFILFFAISSVCCFNL